MVPIECVRVDASGPDSAIHSIIGTLPMFRLSHNVTLYKHAVNEARKVHRASHLLRRLDPHSRRRCVGCGGVSLGTASAQCTPAANSSIAYPTPHTHIDIRRRSSHCACLRDKRRPHHRVATVPVRPRPECAGCAFAFLGDAERSKQDGGSPLLAARRGVSPSKL